MVLVKVLKVMGGQDECYVFGREGVAGSSMEAGVTDVDRCAHLANDFAMKVYAEANWNSTASTEYWPARTGLKPGWPLASLKPEPGRARATQ